MTAAPMPYPAHRQGRQRRGSHAAKARPIAIFAAGASRAIAPVAPKIFPPDDRSARSRHRRVADERVALPLSSEGARRSVPGYERHLVPQGPELAGDRVEQVLVVTHRKVGT